MSWFQSIWRNELSDELLHLNWLPNQAWPHGHGSTHTTTRRSRRTWCLCPASMCHSARERPSSPSTSSWVCCPPPPATACSSATRHDPGQAALPVQSIVFYRMLFLDINACCVSAIDLHFRFYTVNTQLGSTIIVLNTMQMLIFQLGAQREGRLCDIGCIV